MVTHRYDSFKILPEDPLKNVVPKGHTQAEDTAEGLLCKVFLRSGRYTPGLAKELAGDWEHAVVPALKVHLELAKEQPVGLLPQDNDAPQQLRRLVIRHCMLHQNHVHIAAVDGRNSLRSPGPCWADLK